MEPFQISLAPSRLTQTINPWTWAFQGAQIGLFNIDLGQSRDPTLERRMLDEVGSYGRQIGQIGDALGAVVDYLERLNLGPLDAEEKKAVTLLKAQLIEVNRLKHNRQNEKAAA
ncbi:MAG: hypothetical protein ACHP7N_16880 [Caulobacterales bacterium]